MPKLIETMAPEKAAEYLRSYGLRISKETIWAGLQQGKFPFGLYIESVNGNPVYLVFAKQLRAWARERMVDVDERPV